MHVLSKLLVGAVDIVVVPSASVTADDVIATVSVAVVCSVGVIDVAKIF